MLELAIIALIVAMIGGGMTLLGVAVRAAKIIFLLFLLVAIVLFILLALGVSAFF